ncbi:MAG: hypothetical protein JO337_08840, partial [Acidimicrobiales bacterium]|nr:hypothetical protein [Acidimicrobiales bacterium]
MHEELQICSTAGMARVLWPGDVGPLETTPDRRPGSIRRTMTVDGSRPDGPRGDVVITGRGRDLWTAADGSTVTLAHERL